MTSLILAGLGVAGAALTARLLTRSFREIQKRAASLPNTPMFTSYYKGGFEAKMSRREAGLILGALLILFLDVYAPINSKPYSPHLGF